MWAAPLPLVVLGSKVTPGGFDDDDGSLPPGLDVGRIIGVPE